MGTYKEKHYIGNVLHAILKDRDMTVTQFANEIGINRVTIQYYLSNKECPSIRTIKTISEYFSLPVEYFINPINNQTIIDEVNVGKNTIYCDSLPTIYLHRCPRCNHIVKIQGIKDGFPKFCEECGLELVKSDISNESNNILERNLNSEKKELITYFNYYYDSLDITKKIDILNKFYKLMRDS